ncbi:EpsG family protein [Kaistella carnis]|uniref:EpsG family protein n=1 Tax=Kaistella carnis TaxID=1241979 RepID=UPI00289D16FA|nr:EpsG family protein [Kaistella carnis]
MDQSEEMEVYYLIFIVAFFNCFFDFVRFKFLKGFVYFLFCVVLILIVVSRNIGVDNDSPMYEQYFYYFGKETITDIIEGGAGHIEKGYEALNLLVATLGGTFRTVLIIVGVATGLLNFYFFYKKSPYPFFSLLSYLSFFLLYRDFTQIRYALCCAICFWCVHFYINKKYVNAFICFLFAISFHNSAFILLPILPFISWVRNKYLYMLLPIPAFFIGYYFNLFPLLLQIGISNEHMEIYKTEDGAGGYAVSIIGYAICVLFIFINKNIKDNREYLIYFRLVAIGVSLNFLFIQSAIFQRFTLLLFQFSVLLLPFIVKTIRYSSVNKMTFFVIYFMFCVFFLLYGIKMIDEQIIRPYNP